MVKEQVLTVSLEEFGLSKYEAQAYVALISKEITDILLVIHRT